MYKLFDNIFLVAVVFIMAGECQNNPLLVGRVYAIQYHDNQEKLKPKAFRSLLNRFEKMELLH